MFVAALRAGELDDVDAAAAWIGRHATSADLARLLTAEIAPSLAAAAHGSIFLAQMPRIASRGELTGELLRPLARELGRQPEWRLTWFEHAEARIPGALPAEALARSARRDAATGRARLRVHLPAHVAGRTPRRRGRSARELRTQAVDFDAGARVILRAAAWSMLQEPADHAPYGWSHCLTMPQAVLSIAAVVCSARPTRWRSRRPTSSGFGLRSRPKRSTRRGLPRLPTPICRAPSLSDPDAATRRGVARAASDVRPRSATQLATRAAVHHDAHLAKYTLACLDAAAWDASFAHLYLAAAARLHGVWVGLDAATRVTAGVPA